jgi:hypothetical protein
VRKALTITPEQADTIRELLAAETAVKTNTGIAVLMAVRGHGITAFTDAHLDGTTLTVTVPDADAV